MRVSIYDLSQGGKSQTVAAMSKEDAKTASDINKMGMIKVQLGQKATLHGDEVDFRIVGDDGHEYGYLSIGESLNAKLPIRFSQTDE